MSIRALGSDLILPRVHALSTKPPVLAPHWSPLRDPLRDVLVPTMVWFSSWWLLLWKIVLLTTLGLIFFTTGSELLSTGVGLKGKGLLARLASSCTSSHGFLFPYRWKGFSGDSQAGEDPWRRPANCPASYSFGGSSSSRWERSSVEKGERLSGGLLAKDSESHEAVAMHLMDFYIPWQLIYLHDIIFLL